MSPAEQGIEGVAADASARVGEILAEAERDARAVAEEAEREAAETRRHAEGEAERIAAEALEAAREAARERATRLAEIQAALTARGPMVIEGLEGEGLTRARLEALIEAFVASAEQLAEEAEHGAPLPAREEAADREPPAADEAASAEEPADAAVEDDPVAAAEDLAQPVAGAASDGESSRNGDGDGADPGEPSRYDGPLPEGAPLKRRPGRSRERDARFAALLLAVQGRGRRDVEAHLRSEYGFADCEPILDEVFGPARA